MKKSWKFDLWQHFKVQKFNFFIIFWIFFLGKKFFSWKISGIYYTHSFIIFRTHIFLNLGEIFFSISSKLTILFENFKILHICIFFGLFQKACWKVAFIYLFQCGFKRWFQNWFQISPATNGSHTRVKKVLYFKQFQRFCINVQNIARFSL